LESLALPPEAPLTLIDACCFEGCSALRGVITVPRACERIRDNVFKGLKDLARIEIGKANDTDPDPPLKEIGSSAFSETPVGPVVRLGEAFCDLGPFAFSGCPNLKAFLLPPKSQLTRINTQTFNNTPLERIVAPGVEDVVHEAFKGCRQLKEAIFYDENCLKPNHETRLPDKCFDDLQVFIGISDATIKKKREVLKGKPFA
jgi:hypothetical protein